ncbi:peptide chain release factor N(5)-glutamine methyltransferase [Pedobacter insulae]|uniref:Release factor glutamine methyltransferase n=1 Tax=Pedobacter insulae TaxID=414048 RepID=A0A1I3AK89_9SPHI|nr:peptide chain release factor N(5)-glutamine methyltransferase [Pedobacter insulae]SFH50455.1 release factor glutamine methyltransferase [Pedobacter insulae]
MKIKELALLFENDLRQLYGNDEAKSLFLLALEHITKLNRAAFFLNSDKELTPPELKELKQILDQLETGKPIQYIIGETVFYRLIFKVNEFVLIPRPETEELVEWVIERVNSSRLPSLRQSFNILDIGTGSGCIAISLKKNLANAAVTALDISSEALRLAQKNAIINKVELTFIETDILEIPTDLNHSKYNIIISNPPYITQREKDEMHENVLANEPHLALFVSNEQPLIFYEAIADLALTNLLNEGFLFFEINEHLGKETINMLLTKGFINIILRKDMQGKDRMICAQLPN